MFAKTARAYDAIVAEFGDDMVACDVRRPNLPSVSAQAGSLQAENQNLRADLDKIHKTLELISEGTANGSRSELQALEAALASRQNELSEVRVRLQERERELELLRKSAAATQSEAELLRAEVAKRSGLPDSSVSLERIAKETAKDATGRDAKFCEMIDRLRINDLLPNEFVKQLERELRGILSTDDRNLSLHDLITQARDSESLTEKGIDLAHTIRRHRNILTHENTDTRTHSARVLLCLFAAALLWPEFSEA